jgi:hypothetical protein
MRGRDDGTVDLTLIFLEPGPFDPPLKFFVLRKGCLQWGR